MWVFGNLGGNAGLLMFKFGVWLRVVAREKLESAQAPMTKVKS
jgi:hypothetical protein